MKIIVTDNYARDHISDRLIAEGLNESDAEKICTLLNDDPSRDKEEFYKAVDDNYVLYDGACIYY